MERGSKKKRKLRSSGKLKSRKRRKKKKQPRSNLRLPVVLLQMFIHLFIFVKVAFCVKMDCSVHITVLIAVDFVRIQSRKGISSFKPTFSFRQPRKWKR